MDVQKIIDTFHKTVPAMADVTDDELKSDIEVYADYVGEKRFGKLFPKALAFFIAHMRTLNEMIAEDGGGGGGATGVLTQEREGDLERSYQASTSSTDTATGILLKKTYYGQMFLQLRSMIVVPITVRKGCYCGCY